MSQLGERKHVDGWERLRETPIRRGGMSQSEIARIVGCSKSSVYLVEKKALEKLRLAAEQAIHGKEAAA